MLAAVTSSEITLKGKNKRFFEDSLISNLRHSLPFPQVTITKKGTSRFLISADCKKAELKESLEKVFGIDIISFVNEVPLDLEAIKSSVLSYDLKGKSISVKTKRSDKRFALRSKEVNAAVGAALVKAGCSVDLDNPDETIYIDILDKSALVSIEKSKGLGGLPVGSSGKVLSLLSGGIDSPVASWLMMKRGCSVDYLHVHSFEKDVKSSKIVRLVQKLKDYHPQQSRLFLAPYDEFYKRSMELDSGLELVLFRRFLIRLANRIARKNNHKGIVMGDSIGQVASQTLDNLMLTDNASALPIFRPLVAFNKEEIISIAVKLGTYEPSLEQYKDCCSLVADRRPSTAAKHWEIGKYDEWLDQIVEATLPHCEIIKF